MPELPMADLLHTTVNRRWRLAALLGETPAGAVFEAEVLDPAGGRCAIRLLQWSTDATSPPFLPDLQAMQGEEHAALLRTFQTGEIRVGPARGAMFLAQELGRPATREDLVPLARALVAALLHLRTRDRIHGRVKPSNVLWTPSGWKLADLGLVPARPRELLADAISKSAVQWLAPEVLRGELGPAADMWGLGATLLFLLTGQAPYRGSLEEVCEHLMVGPPPSTDHLPAPFDVIVPGCLQRDVARRWTAARVQAALEGTLYLPEPLQPLLSPVAHPRPPELVEIRVGARVSALLLSDDGGTLVAGLRDRALLLRRDGQPAWEVQLPGVPAVVRWADPDRLFSGCLDGVCRTVAVSSGSVVAEHRLEGPVYDLTGDGQGGWLAALGRHGLWAGGPQGGWRLVDGGGAWRVATGDGVTAVGWLDGTVSMGGQRRVLHAGPVTGLVHVPGGFVSVSWDGSVVFLELDGSCRPLSPGGASPRGCVAASMAGVVVGSNDGEVLWWSGDASPVGMVSYDTAVRALALSAHPAMLATARRGTIMMRPLRKP